MDQYKSPAFGLIDLPKSVTDMLTLINEISNSNVYMWRGQSNADWPIHSTAYRRHIFDSKSPTRKAISYYEEQYLLVHARHRGFDFFEGRKLTDLELLARLQHHGAATRLVDFTRSALIALFFASEQYPSSIGSLIGVHTNYLEGHEGQLENRIYSEIEAELEKKDHPDTWQPSGVSVRVAAQRSQFLYSRISNEPRGSLQIHKTKKAFLTIGVSPSVKIQLLKFLRSSCDIHRVSLFPDLDGFALAQGVNTPVFGNERW